MKGKNNKDFREGDKVIIIDSGIFTGVVNKGVNENGKMSVDCGNGPFYLHMNHVFHDPNRKVMDVVKKSIEENEEIPKRMVKRYINIRNFNSGKAGCFLYETEHLAKRFINNPDKYVKIAHEIELEE